MGHVHRIAGTLRRMGWLMLLVAAPVFAAGDAFPQRSETGGFGGEAHEGAPSLDLTAALVQAGGGPEKFSMQTALVSLLGAVPASQELAKLRRQYGIRAVQRWLRIDSWLIAQGLVQLRNIGTALPPVPDSLAGNKLAVALVDAGVVPGDGTFWSSYWYDRLFSHPVNRVLEEDLGRRYGERKARSAYAVNNQVMFDISQSLHAQDVRLATLH